MESSPPPNPFTITATPSISNTNKNNPGNRVGATRHRCCANLFACIESRHLYQREARNSPIIMTFVLCSAGDTAREIDPTRGRVALQSCELGNS